MHNHTVHSWQTMAWSEFMSGPCHVIILSNRNWKCDSIFLWVETHPPSSPWSCRQTFVALTDLQPAGRVSSKWHPRIVETSIRCHHALYLPARLGDDQAAPLTRLSPGAPRVLLAARPPGEPPPAPVLPLPAGPRALLAAPSPHSTLGLPCQLGDNEVFLGRCDAAQLATKCLAGQPRSSPRHLGLREMVAPAPKTCHSQGAACREFWCKSNVKTGSKITVQ